MLLIVSTKVGDGDIALTNAWKHMMEDAKLHHWNCNAVPLSLEREEKELDIMALVPFPLNMTIVYTTHVQIQKTMVA